MEKFQYIIIQFLFIVIILRKPLDMMVAYLIPTPKISFFIIGKLLRQKRGVVSWHIKKNKTSTFYIINNITL